MSSLLAQSNRERGEMQRNGVRGGRQQGIGGHELDAPDGLLAGDARSVEEEQNEGLRQRHVLWQLPRPPHHIDRGLERRSRRMRLLQHAGEGVNGRGGRRGAEEGETAGSVQHRAACQNCMHSTTRAAAAT